MCLQIAADPWPVVWLLHFWTPYLAASRCERARLAVDSISGVSVSVMSFRQQLARQTVNLQQAYEVETKQMMQQWLAETREQFIQACQAASQRRRFFACLKVDYPGHLTSRGVADALLCQQLQGILAELGFHDGTVSTFAHLGRGVYRASVSAKWSPDDATSTSPEPMPTATGGIRVTCPICHEHRPAVVLVPCGHVVCRDCHRSQQLPQGDHFGQPRALHGLRETADGGW